MAPGKRHFFSCRYDQELHEMRTQRRDKESKAATLRWEAIKASWGGIKPSQFDGWLTKHLVIICVLICNGHL